MSEAIYPSWHALFKEYLFEDDDQEDDSLDLQEDQQMDSMPSDLLNCQENTEDFDKLSEIIKNERFQSKTKKYTMFSKETKQMCIKLVFFLNFYFPLNIMTF